MDNRVDRYYPAYSRTWRCDVNDAQTWTLIGGFLAILVAMAGLVLRVVQVQIESVNQHVEGVTIQLGGRIDGVEAKLDLLDRDVQRLIEDRFRGS